MKRPEIDPIIARALRDQNKLTWREVGVTLAKRTGRETAFQADSVRAAVYRHEHPEDLT